MCEWIFKSAEGNNIVKCSFRPIKDVIVYKIHLRKDVIVSVEDAWGVKWSADTARLFQLTGYEENESFEEYRLRSGAKISPLVMVWSDWERIRMLQRIYDVPVTDERFIKEVITGKPSSYPMVVTVNPLDTFVEEIKNVMRNKCTWTIEERHLGVLAERGEPISSKLASTVAVRGDKTISLIPREEGVMLLPDEPVDEYVNRGIKWMNVASKPRRIIYETPMNKKATRIALPNSDAIRALIQEHGLKKVIFVTEMPWYDIMQLECRILVNHATREKCVLTYKKGRAYVDDKSFAEETILKRFSSFQRIGLHQIREIEPEFYDGVFFFSESYIRQRWVQWCESRCGKRTKFILVGKQYSVY